MQSPITWFVHRMKDGNGQRLYPRSSFTINCTGSLYLHHDTFSVFLMLLCFPICFFHLWVLRLVILQVTYVKEMLYYSHRKCTRSIHLIDSPVCFTFFQCKVVFDSWINCFVFLSFDKMTRGGELLGKRTIAGRIVKESYGVAKQQHTFTVRLNRKFWEMYKGWNLDP